MLSPRSHAHPHCHSLQALMADYTSIVAASTVFGTLATDSMSSALVLSLAGLTTAAAVAATVVAVPAISELAANEKPPLSLGGR